MSASHTLANLIDTEKEKLRGITRQISEFRMRCALLQREIELQESSNKEAESEGEALSSRLETVRRHMHATNLQLEDDQRRIQELKRECVALVEEQSSLAIRSRAQITDGESLQRAIHLVSVRYKRPKVSLATQILILGSDIGVNTQVTCRDLRHTLVQVPTESLDCDLPIGKSPQGLAPISNVRRPSVPEYGILAALEDDLTELISGLNSRSDLDE
jgi:hypothetical protein